MSATCTAHISVKTDTISGTVSIKYCSHHVGHDTDIRHLRLSSAVRLEVASLLYQGATVGEVIENMHNRLGDTGTLPRDSLLCRLVVLTVVSL